MLTFQEHMLVLISFYLLLASFQQSMLTFQEVCAHILGTYVGLSSHFTSFQEVCAHILVTYVGLSSHFTSSQPHFSNLCSHFRKSVLTFQEHMLVSHLILPHCQEVCAHILGTYVGLSSHFTSFQQSMLTFQEHMLVSHLILPPLSSHFRKSVLTFQ